MDYDTLTQAEYDALTQAEYDAMIQFEVYNSSSTLTLTQFVNAYKISIQTVTSTLSFTGTPYRVKLATASTTLSFLNSGTQNKSTLASTVMCLEVSVSTDADLFLTVTGSLALNVFGVGILNKVTNKDYNLTRRKMSMSNNIAREIVSTLSFQVFASTPKVEEEADLSFAVSAVGTIERCQL